MTQTKLPFVMLVDDELSILEALERDLRGRFHCIKCQNFDQAKEELRKNPEIKILVSDEYLAGKYTGLDLLHWAQLHKPMIVRCLISGKMEAEQITESLGKGLYHRFFFKPWDAKILQLQLKECLVMSDLLRESKLDPLTGLLNRRGFEEHLVREMERCTRHQRDLSIIVWDLDHFKSINDLQGHSAGDSCLKEFAIHLSSGLRNIDYVSRLGGDEFAILLPDTPLKKAAQVAQRIHQGVVAKMGPQATTVSAGVAQWKSEDANIQTLLQRADEMLYLAKQNGRNQVRVQD